MRAPAAKRMIVPGPARRRVDLEADAAAQALARGDSNRFWIFCHLRHPVSTVIARREKRAIQTLRHSGMVRRTRPGISRFPGWSEGPDPESRDSGFDASHRPGMTSSLLAMTFGLSGLFQFAINRVIRIADLLAAVKSCPVVGRQRETQLQAARQVGIGDEDTPECDRVGMAG